jgi:hypothetical protein
MNHDMSKSMYVLVVKLKHVNIYSRFLGIGFGHVTVVECREEAHSNYIKRNKK